MRNTISKSLFILAPFFGVIIFVVLYITATLFYPGGSQANANSIGFSWINNYWCNLLNEVAINGKPNPARPIALSAMVVICLSLGGFWYNFPIATRLKKVARITIQISGTVAMIIAMFLFTNLHDVVINVATICGLIAIVGTFIALYKMKWKLLFWFGMLNLPLVVLNNILYYGNGFKYLPVVQKITFLVFLLWICMMNLKLYKEQKLLRQ